MWRMVNGHRPSHPGLPRHTGPALFWWQPGKCLEAMRVRSAAGSGPPCQGQAGQREWTLAGSGVSAPAAPRCGSHPICGPPVTLHLQTGS